MGKNPLQPIMAMHNNDENRHPHAAIKQSAAKVSKPAEIDGKALTRRSSKAARSHTKEKRDGSGATQEDAVGIIDQYEKMGKIGEGTYGVVYKARDLKTNHNVAMKLIRVEKDDDGIPPTTIREISLLTELNHPNVIKYVFLWMCRDSLATAS